MNEVYTYMHAYRYIINADKVKTVLGFAVQSLVETVKTIPLEYGMCLPR